MSFWESFIDALGSFFSGIIKALGGGTPEGTAEEAGALLAEAGEAMLRLISLGGVQNVGQFLLELQKVHDSAEATGASPDDKYGAFISAARIIWQDFNGILDAPGLNTILDWASAFFHAKTKLEQIK